MERCCDLCGEASATMYCESDAARLCVKCDEKVHGANFLVAKHERSLLCSVCQSVTSWKASGPRLGRTVSVCDGCVCDREDDEVVVKEEVEVESRDRSDGDEEPDGSSDDDDEDEDEEEIEDEDEDEENQVVPWSSGEEASFSSIGGGGRHKLKRRREEVEEGSGDWDSSRTASRPFGVNRFSDQNAREIRSASTGIL